MRCTVNEHTTTYFGPGTARPLPLKRPVWYLLKYSYCLVPVTFGSNQFTFVGMESDIRLQKF